MVMGEPSKVVGGLGLGVWDLRLGLGVIVRGVWAFSVFGRAFARGHKGM